jgi:hypothetical protein
MIYHILNACKAQYLLFGVFYSMLVMKTRLIFQIIFETEPQNSRIFITIVSD